MSRSPGYSYPRYLAAKKSLDDRSLNRQVWQRFAELLPQINKDRPLRLLEVGAGIGTMIERVLEERLLSRATYTAIDADVASIGEAARRLPGRAAQHGLRVSPDRRPGSSSQGRRWRLRVQPDQRAEPDAVRDVTVELEAVELSAFVRREQGHQTWDVLLAHAFLDLVDVVAVLPELVSVLSPGGLVYSTLTFDGATIFQPQIEPRLDAQIEALYHRSMDQRHGAGARSGGSRAGRQLFGHMRTAGLEVIAAGSSDWVVFAGPDGYPADEAYFLGCILDTLETALDGHPELDARRFADWLARRRAQLEDGALVYIAHQLDLLGRLSKKPPA